MVDLAMIALCLLHGPFHGWPGHDRARRAAAGPDPRLPAHLRAPRRPPVTLLYWIAGVLALGLFIYLLVALLNPEAFEW